MSKSLALLAVAVLVSLSLSPSVAISEILFEEDFESGVPQYIGSGNRHPGGGFISYMGGEITSPLNPGDGNDDFRTHQNVVVVNESEARGAVSGSEYSAKTWYRAGNTASFQDNTTIIRFPGRQRIHIRWYQKWSNSWIWPADQQKLCKVNTSLSRSDPQYWSQNFKLSFGNDFVNLTKLSPNDNQFETFVFGVWNRPETEFRKADSIANGLSGPGSDSEFRFSRDRWYSIEVMISANTPGQSDGEYKYWVDGKLVFHLMDANTRGNRTSFVDTVELQHVAQFAGQSSGNTTMPTYMDNIVISTSYIGPNCPDCKTPNPPSIQ